MLTQKEKGYNEMPSVVAAADADAAAAAGDSCLSQFVNHQIALNALFRSMSMVHGGPLGIS